MSFPFICFVREYMCRHVLCASPSNRHKLCLTMCCVCVFVCVLCARHASQGIGLSLIHEALQSFQG